MNLEPVKRAIVEIQQQKNIDYIRSKKLEPYCDYSATQIGKALVKLEKIDWVERWAGTSVITWRITIDGPIECDRCNDTHTEQDRITVTETESVCPECRHSQYTKHDSH